MSRGHGQEGSWLATGLTAKEIGAASKVTLGQEGKDRVCCAEGVEARKDGKGGLLTGI